MTKARERGRNSRVSVEELIGEMHRTVDGLVEDGTGRADLKLLSRALKELRHAFRFFDGLRGRPKVTVFGSARLPAGSPACRLAESFGRAMARSGWFVVTGAGEGIMEAAHVGAGREHSIGVNILLPFEQPGNTVMQRNPASHPYEIFLHQEAALSQGVERRRPLSRGVRNDGRGLRGADPPPDREDPPVSRRPCGRARRGLLGDVATVPGRQPAGIGIDLRGGFLPVPDHFKRGGSRRGDPRLLPGVPQLEVRGPGPGDPSPGAARPRRGRRPEQGLSGSPRGGIDLPGRTPCPKRRTNRRSPICPGSFSGSTTAAMAGFAS